MKQKLKLLKLLLLTLNVAEFYKQRKLLMAGAFLDHPDEPLSTMEILTSREAPKSLEKAIHSFKRVWFKRGKFENGPTN